MPALKIGGLQKSSLIDYPGKISAIVFTQGCNFRCPYCHNPELITDDGLLENVNSIVEFLKTRVGKLDGVVITGGEPCIQVGLVEFIAEIKALGFAVKLDTNGSYPEVLKKLLDEKLINYVAMDIKAPIEKYSQVSCAQVDTSKMMESIALLKNSGVDYEFRTTVVKSQLAIEDFEKIGEIINGASRYYLQKFVPTKTLNNKFLSQETYSDEEFEQIRLNLTRYVTEVSVR